MAVVFIPSLLRKLTDGNSTLNVSGTTVMEIIQNMDVIYPGIKEQLIKDDQLIPTLTLLVDGVESQKRLSQKVTITSEVHFLPAIRGG